jgi:hypothetical protein
MGFVDNVVAIAKKVIAEKMELTEASNEIAEVSKLVDVQVKTGRDEAGKVIPISKTILAGGPHGREMDKVMKEIDEKVSEIEGAKAAILSESTIMRWCVEEWTIAGNGILFQLLMILALLKSRSC